MTRPRDTTFAKTEKRMGSVGLETAIEGIAGKQLRASMVY